LVSPGDPLSNPDIFPTGRNQYQYDAAKMPTREAWAVGQRMAEQTLALHRKAHGEFPNKLSVTLWANTLIRTHGALEAEVLYLLGLKPVWDDRGDVKDIELISPLGRSRVDVVMTVTGMYRDSFPEKMLLLDKAVRLANAAPAEAGVKNFVHDNTEKISAELAGKGARPEDSQRLAMLRIFGAQTGSYGTGVGDTLRNSERWSQTLASTWTACHLHSRMMHGLSRRVKCSNCSCAAYRASSTVGAAISMASWT
jgi:cobaltochelatase CobN